ncbi:MAG: DUF4190 domain-containing protein [Clostridia bacterium]
MNEEENKNIENEISNNIVKDDNLDYASIDNTNLQVEKTNEQNEERFNNSSKNTITNPVTSPNKGFAITSFVLGISSIVLLFINSLIGLVCGIVGLILGIVSINKKESTKGLAISGIITSSIGICFVIIMFVILFSMTTAFIAGA